MERPARSDLGMLLLLVVAMVRIVVLHRAAWFESWSDENVHMYVATRLAAGETLYGTMHSARPPLVLLPLAAIIAAGASPFTAARGIQLGTILVTTLVVFWGARRLWCRRAAMAAALVYLLSPAAASTEFTGIELVGLWSTVCVVCALCGRPLGAGLAGALALLTGQHAAIFVAAAAAVSAARGWRSAASFASSFLLLSTIIIGAIVSAGGHAVWTDLVAHHAHHLAGEAMADLPLAWWLGAWSLEHAPILALAACTPILDRLRPSEPSILLPGIVAVHLTVVVAMVGGQILYVQPAVPLLAIAAGRALAIIVVALRAGDANDAKRRLAAGLLVVLAALTVAGWSGASATFALRDKRDYSLLPHRRRLEMRRVSQPVVAEKLAAAVHAADDAEGTIFGHPTIATLVALHSGRRIAAELADLDPRWFFTGVMSREDVIDRIERDHVELFITPAWFFQSDPHFAAYLRRCYDEPTIFPRADGSGIPKILLYRRRAIPRPCAP